MNSLVTFIRVRGPVIVLRLATSSGESWAQTPSSFRPYATVSPPAGSGFVAASSPATPTTISLPVIPATAGEWWPPSVIVPTSIDLVTGRAPFAGIEPPARDTVFRIA
jgi:hypothetical protein